MNPSERLYVVTIGNLVFTGWSKSNEMLPEFSLVAHPGEEYEVGLFPLNMAQNLADIIDGTVNGVQWWADMPEEDYLKAREAYEFNRNKEVIDGYEEEW